MFSSVILRPGVLVRSGARTLDLPHCSPERTLRNPSEGGHLDTTSGVEIQFRGDLMNCGACAFTKMASEREISCWLCFIACSKCSSYLLYPLFQNGRKMKGEKTQTVTCHRSPFSLALFLPVSSYLARGFRVKKRFTTPAKKRVLTARM